jgi:bisphosphoglycerate-independent phosphoglycerate mutase (AlkP superfamily)
MQKVLLVILDGWGWSPIRHGNLLLETETPGLDTLLGLSEWTLLKTASLEVGLPWGSVGDSELGHYNLGTGRVVVRWGGEDRSFVEIRERSALLAGTREEDGTAGRLADTEVTSSPITSLGTILEGYGFSSLKIATGPKLALLTQAMNGYPSLPLSHEKHCELSDEGHLEELLRGQPELLAEPLTVINLAAADLAAHRGDLAGVRAAVRLIDHGLQGLFQRAQQEKAILYLVSDHGGLEQMLTEHDQVLPDHSTAPVVFARIDCQPQRRVAWATHEQQKGRIALSTPTGLLADVAPTLLEEFDLSVPKTMVGISLLKMLR